MRHGADIAFTSAGAVILDGNLHGVRRCLLISRAAMRKVKQSVGYALAYNVVAIPLAAGCLLPSFGISLSPGVAALMMASSSLAVVGNALRLRLELQSIR